MKDQAFTLLIESAGYIEENGGPYSGFGWYGEERPFSYAELPNRWDKNWVLVMQRSEDEVEVFVDGDVLGSLVGRGNVTHLDWAWTFGGRRFYSVHRCLGDIIHHITYRRRSQREREVAERVASLLEWLLWFYRDGTGIEILDACKLVGDEHETRADAIRDVVGDGCSFMSAERDTVVILAGEVS